jgi:arylsulfatase A
MLATGLSSATALCAARPPAAVERPNVLLVITDDQAYGDLSLHGNPILETPNLDRLGNENIRLDQFYVGSICAPTRASLLTGRYHLRTGTMDVTRRGEVLNPAETTLGELFKANGYRTGYFGKWHNGSVYPETPDGQGFDTFIGFPYGHITCYFDPVLHHNQKLVQRKGYITDIFTDDAIEFITKDSEPFFCYLAYNAPHTPVMAPQPLIEKYQKAGLDDRTAGIYAMLESLDTNMGRLLEKAGDNTLVIFLSDNGPAYDRYNSNLKGRKAGHHEGGVRVPSFWRWPARWTKPAVVSRRLLHIDVLPTLAELCGLSETENLELDGDSFAALLDDPAADWPDRTLYIFASGAAGDARRLTEVGSVRTDRWLAVKHWAPWELYDLLADPFQKTNLAETYPDVLGKLRSGFDRAYAEFSINGIKQTPITVGNPQCPEVLLEAHDANLQKADNDEIGYNYPAGFAHNWITGWSNTAAFCEWLINVQTEGLYSVTLHYGLSPDNTGVKLKLHKLEFLLNEPAATTLIEQPYLLPIEAQKYETRIWAQKTVGTIELKPGVQTLHLNALDIPGEQALDLKAIELKQIPTE